jgi:sialic acid synthase SpsE
LFKHALNFGISDHTTDFTLWHKYHPSIIEWHFKLEDSTGLDAGSFARTPEMLEEIL